MVRCSFSLKKGPFKRIENALTVPEAILNGEPFVSVFSHPSQFSLPVPMGNFIREM
jgi:hypothetical protein